MRYCARPKAMATIAAEGRDDCCNWSGQLFIDHRRFLFRMKRVPSAETATTSLRVPSADSSAQRMGPSAETVTTLFGKRRMKTGKARVLFSARTRPITGLPLRTGPNRGRKGLPAPSELIQQARDLRRAPFSIAARRLDAASIELGCNGSQARCAGLPKFGNDGVLRSPARAAARRCSASAEALRVRAVGITPRSPPSFTPRRFPAASAQTVRRVSCLGSGNHKRRPSVFFFWMASGLYKR
jgi:hypothetical protein